MLMQLLMMMRQHGAVMDETSIEVIYKLFCLRNCAYNEDKLRSRGFRKPSPGAHLRDLMLSRAVQ